MHRTAKGLFLTMLLTVSCVPAGIAAGLSGGGGGGNGPVGPAAPGSLTAIVSDDTTIQLTWLDQSTDETGFVLERSTQAGAGFTQVGTTLPPESTGFPDAGLTPATTYFYRVQATNERAKSAFSNVATATTLPPKPTIDRVVPDSGAAGEPIRIEGDGFVDYQAGMNAVMIGGFPASAVDVVDDRTIRCTSPIGPAPAAAEVQVTNANGTGTLSGAFTYFGWPPRFGESQIDDSRVASSVGAPVVCAAGRNVYAAWLDGRREFRGGADVYFNRSTDGGETWREDDYELFALEIAEFGFWSPALVCESNHVYALWTTNHEFQGPRIQFAGSTDAGATWTHRRRFSNVSFNYGVSPDLCCDGTSVYVVWSNTSQVRFNRSLDAGASWLPDDILLDTGESYLEPRICCSGAEAYVVWQERVGIQSSGIWFIRSSDSGLTWRDARRLDEACPGSAATICCQGSSVHVVYGNDCKNVKYRRSIDGGASWDPERGLDDAPARSPPVVCCDGVGVFAFWQAGDGFGFMQFTGSADGGATWPNRHRFGSQASDGRICCDRKHVTVVWAEPGRNIRLNASLDGGTSWLGSDIPLWSDDPFTYYGLPSLACDGARVHVACVATHRMIKIPALFIKYRQP